MADTSTRHERRVDGGRKRRARPWHRVIGLLTVLPLLWVVITGALLNHTVDWRLDERMIDHPWVMKAYGMAPEGEPEMVKVGGFQVVEWDGLIFANGDLIDVSGPLVGAVADGDGVAIVTASHVVRMDPWGEQIEMLGSASLPDVPLTGVSDQDGRIQLRTQDGWYEVMDDWLEFGPAPGSPEAQRMLQMADGPERRLLRKAWSQGGMPASRILLDLHAGHFLGSFGRYLNDFVTLSTIVLCVTGVILFFRKPRRAR